MGWIKDKVWPPNIGEFIAIQQSDIMIPFPFMPELKLGNMGPFFELRTYTYFAGGLPQIMKNWENTQENKILMPSAFSPLQ